MCMTNTYRHTYAVLSELVQIVANHCVAWQLIMIYLAFLFCVKIE